MQPHFSWWKQVKMRKLLSFKDDYDHQPPPTNWCHHHHHVFWTLLELTTHSRTMRASARRHCCLRRFGKKNSESWAEEEVLELGCGNGNFKALTFWPRRVIKRWWLMRNRWCNTTEQKSNPFRRLPQSSDAFHRKPNLSGHSCCHLVNSQLFKIYFQIKTFWSKGVILAIF